MNFFRRFIDWLVIRQAAQEARDRQNERNEHTGNPASEASDRAIRNALPRQSDFDPYGCLDAQTAWKNFGGLSLEDACARFCEDPEIYQEDFMFMGSVAFAWYFPVIERYLYESRLEDEDDEVTATWILAHCIVQQLEPPVEDCVDQLRPQVLKLARHVRENLAQYCVEPREQTRIDEAWQELEQTAGAS